MERRNVFADFAAAFGENPELCLNTGLVVLLRRNPVLLAAFLRWISEASGLHIEEDAEWSVHGELPVDDRRKIFPDMVLKSGGLELWFEHKLGSTLKLTELTRYINECQVCMSHQGGRRIAVFVISGRKQDVSRFVDWRDRFSELGWGYAWSGDSGYLSWRDLLPRLRTELSTLDGIDKRLAEDFVEWWWTHPAVGAGKS